MSEVRYKVAEGRSTRNGEGRKEKQGENGDGT